MPPHIEDSHFDCWESSVVAIDGFWNESSRLNSLNESKSSFGMNLNIEGTWNLSVPFDQVSSSIVSFMEEHLDVSNTSLSHEYDQIAPPAKALIVSSASTLKWNRSGSSDNATSNTTFVQTRRSKRARTSTNLGASLLRRDCDDERDDDETKRRNFIPHPRENYVAQLPRATFLKYKEHAVEVSRAFLASVLSISSSSSSMSQDLMDVAKGVRTLTYPLKMISRRSNRMIRRKKSKISSRDWMMMLRGRMTVRNRSCSLTNIHLQNLNTRFSDRYTPLQLIRCERGYVRSSACLRRCGCWKTSQGNCNSLRKSHTPSCCVESVTCCENTCGIDVPSSCCGVVS